MTIIEAQVSETKDRVTRMETRQLQIMEHLGMEPQGRKPRWVPEPSVTNGIIDLPSLGCSIKDIIAAIPPDFRGETILVMFKGACITTLAKEPFRVIARTLRREA